jgi:hypothetical protein
VEALVGSMRGGGSYSRIIFYSKDHFRQKEGGDKQVSRWKVPFQIMVVV